MWLCLLGMIAGFLIHVCITRSRPVPELTGESTVCGRIRRKDFRNGKEILYLKNVEIIDSSSGVSARISSSDKLSYGIICTLNEEGLQELSHPMNARVCVTGRLSVIAPATNPGEFDAAGYYNARGYAYRMFEGEVVRSQGGNAILEFLYRIRRKAVSVLTDSFGEKNGGILAAMLFGDKEYLDPEMKELYQAGGISHILAISGLHISLIGVFMYAVLGLVPMKDRTAASLTVLILVLYAFMTGFGASVFRAVFMFSARLLAKQLKRPYDAPTALMESAFLISLFYPGLVSDSSFLLSHVAVGGILLFSPLFAPAGKGRKKVIDSVGIGISVFLSTLPVLLSNTGTFSFAGLLLNLFVLPLMPVLFVCVFLFLLTTPFIPRLAELFSYVANSILYLMEYLCNCVNKTGIFMLHCKAPGIGRRIIYTILVVGLCALAWRIKRDLRLRHIRLMNRIILDDSKEAEGKLKKLKRIDGLVRIGLLALLFACFLFLISAPKKSTITFLDVGQGDGIFIRTPSKTICMIDGGSTSKNKLGENILMPYLEYEGEVKVDYWFLSHADKDHISGFEEVLAGEEIEIKTLVLPFCGKEDFAEIEELAKAEGTEVFYAKAGDRIADRKGRFSFTVLSPELEVQYEDRNAASLVLLYETKDLCAAFMGDAGFEAESAVETYLAGKRLTILKSAHHGSANGANSEEFYRTVRPETVIISCGRNNLYGHPHAETLERIGAVDAVLRRTDYQGAVIW